MNIFAKSLAVVVLVVMMSACSSEANSSGGNDYPTKPIEVVVPVGAGGDTDLNTRITAKYLEQELDESIVITNVEGSGGSTGIKELLSKEADGHSVLAYHNAMLVNNIYGLADYTYEDFKYAGVGIIDQSNTFLASKDAEFDDIESLIEYAKENPGQVNVATETGAMTHLQVLEFEQKTGVEFNIVDAGGASDKITALLGGRVDIVPTSLGLVQDYIESGELVSLGIIANDRLDAVEDVPTFAEQGVDMSVDKVFYWAFNPETPDEVVDTFSEALKNVVEDEEYREEIKRNWLNPSYLDPEETADKLQEITENDQAVYDSAHE